MVEANEEKYYLTVKDVSVILQVSTMHVYRLLHSGKIPYTKVVGERSYRIPREPFFRWLAGGLVQS
jgi:excisionase family DNA binding protein